MADTGSWKDILKHLPPTLGCPLFAFVVFIVWGPELYLALAKKFVLNPLLDLVCAVSFLVALLTLTGILCYSMISYILMYNRERRLNIVQLKTRTLVDKGKRIEIQEMQNVVEFFERQK